MKYAIMLVLALLAIGVWVASSPVAMNSDTEESTKVAAEEKAVPTADEQVASLEAMCAKNADAMTARHAEKSLYERLGGEEGINEFTRELVKVHLENKDVAYRFEGLDTERVAHRLALFIISGTGGPAVYDGPELEASHANMKLTNADFMVAGGDVVQAMKNLEYGENEINEMICALVSLRHRVVLPQDGAEQATTR